MTVPSDGKNYARIAKVAVDPARGVVVTSHLLDAALSNERILHVTGGPADSQVALKFWEDVNRCLGRIDLRAENPLTLELLSCVWSDIRYDPDLVSTYRHSKTAQPLHTDGAFHLAPPSVGFFVCEKQAVEGGSTRFLDVDVLCAVLEREQPELFHSLRSTAVTFGKGDRPGQTVPIIARDETGWLINWNYYRVRPGQGDIVANMCKRFFHWLDQRFVRTDQMESLYLERGDCMVFHDLRCLHGRDSFEASRKGDRCLWHLPLHWGPGERPGVQR